MENPPVIDKCGNFSFGRLQEKLNLLFNALIALETAFFAAFIFPVIAETILLKIFVTVFFADVRPDDIEERIPVMADETDVFALFILLLTVERTVSQAVLVADDTADQAAEAVDLIVFTPEETACFATDSLFEM